METLPTDELQSLLAYLETTQAKLLASVQLEQLNQYPAAGGWSQGQVLAHLIRTEQYLYPVFAWLPRLARIPWLVRALDRMNTALCKLAGLGFVSLGDQPDKSGGALQQLNPQFRGRFLAPAFLKPERKPHDWQCLLDGRAADAGAHIGSRAAGAVVAIANSALFASGVRGADLVGVCAFSRQTRGMAYRAIETHHPAVQPMQKNASAAIA